MTIDSIARASSFRLTRDLAVSDANTTAIRIEGTALPGISIDLAGFSLRGRNTCAGTPLVCTRSGFGYGIWALGDRVVVRDGDVSGFDNVAGNPSFSHGIDCFGSCSARGNTVSFNQGFGLKLGTGATYRENMVHGNEAGGASGGVNLGNNHCAGNGVVVSTCP